MPQETPTVNDAYGSSSEAAVGPPNVWLARITNVNMREWTVDTEGVYTQIPLIGVPLGTPYTHRDHAGGINFMPEVDSFCYVAQCKDGTNFILSFVLNPVTHAPAIFDEDEEKIDETAADIDPSFRGNRLPLEPGDIMLGTVDDNQVILRRGGLIQIGSTGLAQRMYIPIENTVRDYFQRYQAFSPVGEIEWGHAVLVNGEDPTAGTGSLPTSNYFLDEGQKNALKTAEKTPVIVRYNIKDLAQEDVKKGKYSVEVRVGRLTKEALDTEVDAEHIFANENLSSISNVLGEGIKKEEKGILSITIYSHDDGANKDKVTYAFQLSRDGDSFIFTKGSVRIEIEKNLNTVIQKDAQISWGSGSEKGGGDSYLQLLESNEFKMACKKVVMEVVNSVEFACKDINMKASNNIDIGDGADNMVTRTESLETWMKTQFKCVTAWGPSGPMIPSFDDTVGSKKVKVKP